MEIIPTLLVIVGIVIAAISAIRLIIQAFGVSFLWGLAVLLINPLVLVHVLLNWHEAKGIFFQYLIGLAMLGVGYWLQGGWTPVVAP